MISIPPSPDWVKNKTREQRFDPTGIFRAARHCFTRDLGMNWPFHNLKLALRAAQRQKSALVENDLSHWVSNACGGVQLLSTTKLSYFLLDAWCTREHNYQPFKRFNKRLNVREALTSSFWKI